MKNMIALLAATTAVSLAPAAYADESSQDKANIEYKNNGGYEATRSTSQTDANGTSVSTDASTDVDVDSNGKVKKTIKNTKVVDPKGMMNKKTDTAKTVYQDKSNGGYKQTTIRSYKDAAGKSVYYKTVTDVDVDADGNVTTVAKTEKTTEPKGWFSWFNKQKSSEMTKTVNGEVVEDKKETN